MLIKKSKKRWILWEKVTNAKCAWSFSQQAIGEHVCSFITLHPTIFPKNEYTHIHHIFAALIITTMAQSNTLSIVFFFCRWWGGAFSPKLAQVWKKRRAFFASALNRFTRIIISLPEEIQATELFSSCPSVHFHRHHQGSHALYANEMSCNGTLLPLSHSGMLNIVHSPNAHTHAL